MNKLNKLNIIFQVDGDNKIGMGHVYRSANLAKALKKYYNVSFLTNNSSAKKILSSIAQCKLLPQKFSVRKKILENSKADVIVLDKLYEKTKNICILKNNSSKIIAIDFVGKNKNFLNFGIPILYPKNAFSSIGKLSSFKFTILNKSFLKRKHIQIKKNVKSILVVQGGSDTHCFIPQIINALNNLDEKITITIILGPAFKCAQNLKKSISVNRHTVRILKNVENMGAEMSKHDIAISAGGMTLLELCFLGIPSIIICAEKFENETSQIIQKNGFGINMGYHSRLSPNKILDAVQQLINDFNIRRKMNKIGTSIVDGKGVQRIIKIIDD